MFIFAHLPDEEFKRILDYRDSLRIAKKLQVEPFEVKMTWASKPGGEAAIHPVGITSKLEYQPARHFRQVVGVDIFYSMPTREELLEILADKAETT